MTPRTIQHYESTEENLTPRRRGAQFVTRNLTFFRPRKILPKNARVVLFHRRVSLSIKITCNPICLKKKERKKFASFLFILFPKFNDHLANG